MILWMAHRPGFSHTLSLVPRSLSMKMPATITLSIVSFSRVSVEELETDNSVSEALDLATLANTRHNVEAGCRQYKQIVTLPTHDILNL